MKQLSKYKLNKISKNLDYFFNQATDKEINDGLRWMITYLNLTF